MLRALVIHPNSRCDAVARIEVEAVRPRPGALLLQYVVSGAIGDLSLPDTRPSAPADELWRHTCFEAFVRSAPGPAYAEFNFSPSTQWAVYRFSDYREGMSVAREINAPWIEAHATGESFTLQAALDLNSLSSLPGDAAWRLGLSAVIEETNGCISYWALAHPPGKADFHHPDCFALELAAPSRI